MKRIYYAILFTLISISTFNCQKEINYSGLGLPGNNNSEPVTATLQGNILDENGQPAANVTVQVGNKTAFTNAKGHFRIVNASLDRKASLVTAQKMGYFKALRTFSATAGANHVLIQLIRKTSLGSVNAATGGTVSVSNGSKITLPADGVVNASGGTYTGSVNVYAAYIDPTRADIDKTVPGSFLATDKTGKKVILASYGMLAVELESAAGEKLQIAPGNTATLTTAIPDALQSSAPAAISLWYVDEQTGLWKEEGTATKNGTSYTGEVKHFSYWNCDVPGPVITLSAKFENSNGLPLVAADIRIRVDTSYASAHGFTDSLGQLNGPVPAGKNLVLQVVNRCNQVIYSKNIGPFSADTDLGTLVINSSSSIVTVQGRLLDCGGEPVTAGYAIINYDNEYRYLRVKNVNGEFETIFYTCTGMPSTYEILGVDETTQQQGSTVTVATSAPITNAGNIIACGSSALEFINYTVDGTDFSISSSSNDSTLYAITYNTQSTPPFATWISAVNVTSNSDIGLYFEHAASTGTYDVVNFSVLNFDSIALVRPFTVTLSSYAASPGEFYEGNFSGKFKEFTSPLTIHTATGSFRIRRR